MPLVVRNLFPRVFGEAEESETFGQILLQPFHLRGLDARA